MRHSVTGFAERVLYGETVQDKLAAWPQVDVRRAQVARTPSEPGRPACLALPRDHRRLPSVFKADLQRDDGRARVLHELFNHELQAIELLAVALLRWPDAPAGFRRALVATLRDEQQHASLYLERLRACGEELGVVPVSTYFWDTLHAAPTPAAFVAGLSLCFEQANLDFCLTWRERFARAGDAATAEVLTTVYEDEIRHVATGLVWFSRWTEGDRLEAWERELLPPLTPARARGTGFDVDGRRRAGLSDDEIERLRVVGGSRGRPPRVLRFDAGVEQAIAGMAPSRMAQVVSDDLAVLPLFLCAEEDVVVAPTPPLAFTSALVAAGIPVPRFVPALDAASLGPHAIRRYEAWGPRPGDVLPEDVEVHEPSEPWRAEWAALSKKTATHARAASLDHPGWVADRGEVWRSLQVPRHARWVLKAPLSTSGTERIVGEGPLTMPQTRWAERQLSRWGELLYQPWYERVLDLSAHVTVGERVSVDGITRFLTAGTGAYRGAVVGRWTRGLEPDVARAVHTIDVQGAVLQAARAAGAWAQELGFQGELSIDAAVVRQGDELAVHPWLETNARRTLGRVALALAGHVHPRSSARWWVERCSEARRTELLAQAARCPAVRQDNRLVEGIVLTTPAQTATGLLTWLQIGGDTP